MKIRAEKLNELKILLEERKQRGIKVDEFCKEKNITIAQFYYYHKQVNKVKTSKDNNHKKSVLKPIQYEPNCFSER